MAREAGRAGWFFRWMMWASLSCVFILFAWQPSFAQQNLTGSIAGVVTDASGAVVPGVTVTVSSSALLTGTRSTTTNAKGYYAFPQLPPGTYNAKFTKGGFTSYSATGITVHSATQVTTNAALKVGAVTQQVTVSAVAATIDTEQPTSQSILSQRTIQNIPTGRSPWALTNMVPGVMTSSYDVGGSSGTQEPSLVEHGSTNNDKRYMIDGVNVNWPGSGGGATFMYYDQGMFQEMNYQTGALPASISAGGVYMNMITKQGSNKVHGTVFMNGASQSMESSNVNPSLANLLAQNLPSSVRNEPGIQLGNPVTDTYDFNGDVGGPLIKNRLWWFTSLRAWTVNTLVSGAFNSNGTQAINDNLITNEMAEFDVQVNPKNKFTLLYTRNQKNRYHRRNSPPYFISDQAAFLQNQLAWTALGSWTYTPSSSWVINGGVGYLRGKFPLRYQPSVTASDIAVEDTGLSTLRNAATFNYLNPNSRTSVDGSATWVGSALGGDHNLTFGMEFTRDYYAQLYRANGDMYGVMINGVADHAVIYNTPINQQTNLFKTTAFYVQDNYTVFHRLTLNLGVRWEWELGSIPAETSPAGTFVGARSYSQINDVPNFNNWTPRLGFSLALNNAATTVIRGSASRYMESVAAGDITASVNPLGISTASVPWNCTGSSCVNGPTLAQLDLSSFNGFVGGATTHIDPNLQRPYSWEYSLGLEQQLPEGIILKVSGWYRSVFNNIGRANLAVTPADYTPYVITNPLTNQPFTVYNQNPSTKGLVNDVLTNSRVLNQEYRGLDIDFTKNMTKHWQMLGGVTIGRDRGAWNGDINSGLNDLNNPNYNINRLGETSLDAPYQFKIAGTYDFPLGFQFSGDYQYDTGYPYATSYTVTQSIDPGLTQVSQDINLITQGPDRLPNVNLADIRISKVFTAFNERVRFKPEFDVYNIGNSSAWTGVHNSANNLSVLGNPTQILSPRIMKVGLNINF